MHPYKQAHQMCFLSEKLQLNCFDQNCAALLFCISFHSSSYFKHLLELIYLLIH